MRSLAHTVKIVCLNTIFIRVQKKILSPHPRGDANLERAPGALSDDIARARVARVTCHRTRCSPKSSPSPPRPRPSSARRRPPSAAPRLFAVTPRVAKKARAISVTPPWRWSSRLPPTPSSVPLSPRYVIIPIDASRRTRDRRARRASTTGDGAIIARALIHSDATPRAVVRGRSRRRASDASDAVRRDGWGKIHHSRERASASRGRARDARSTRGARAQGRHTRAGAATSATDWIFFSLAVGR